LKKRASSDKVMGGELPSPLGGKGKTASPLSFPNG